MIVQTLNHSSVRELTIEEWDLVAGGGDTGYEDSNCNGQFDEGETIVVTANRDTGGGGGSFYGGAWIAGLFGGLFGGGGGEAHGAGIIGLGGGFEIGYSSDDATAAENSDNTELTLPGPIVNLDFDPFTVGIGFDYGGYMVPPGFEKHNSCPPGADNYVSFNQ